jgi:hypothetical protein
MEPAIPAFGVSDAHVDVESVRGLDGARPSRGNLGQILWVHDDGPILQFLLRSSCVSKKRVIDAFDRSVRQIRADETREAINGTALIVDIRVRSAPAGNRASAVVEGVASEEKPSVLAVRTPYAHLGPV